MARMDASIACLRWGTSGTYGAESAVTTWCQADLPGGTGLSPKFWCASAELTAQGCGDGAGDTGTSGQASRRADRASR